MRLASLSNKPRAGEDKKDVRLTVRMPTSVARLQSNECRRQDLNLHGLVGRQPLKLVRLPIPPLRLG